MIKLTYLNKKNVLIYDVEDWKILRTTHRIVCNIIGNNTFIPSLPAELLPEEAALLLDKNLAELYEYPTDSDSETKMVKDSQKKSLFEDELLQAEQKVYKEIRKQQLELLIDKIVEQRNKLLGDQQQRTKEEIFNEELEKSCIVTRENMIWPILLRNSSNNQKLSLISKQVLLSTVNPLKVKVFADLWERGYYITNGAKFGGDFLVYPGDPIINHAIFIVRCIQADKTFTPTELVAFGRLGVSVKKRAVLASLEEENNNQIKYLTINWINA